MNKQNKLLQARIFVGFFMLGLLNNSAYVIMIAGKLPCAWSVAACTPDWNCSTAAIPSVGQVCHKVGKHNSCCCC